MALNKKSLSAIAASLRSLEEELMKEVALRQSLLQLVKPGFYAGASNLIHYLTLRSLDIRNLQNELHSAGLSSLASSESHILRQIQSIQQLLGRKYPGKSLSPCTAEWSQAHISQASQQLFGKRNSDRTPYIMVTFDRSFADDYALVKSLLQNGMNVARINCAHDDEETWSRMIESVKRACRHTNLPCKIYMDLAGPKIRTQVLNKGKEKGKVKVQEGALIWLADAPDGFEEEDVVIGVNEPGIVGKLKKGERVFFDDGIIKGLVEKSAKGKAAVRIVRVSSGKPVIKNEKGINFPDSSISIPPLTDFDRACLPFICQHADMIGYSFVKTTKDVALLHQELNKLSKTPPHVIIKIETTEAVNILPALLFEGMKQNTFGVMIARGDLAVEIGFERLGEIQEEILWICEAAHVPVIWATQVLETLNKSGVATRSEITDAGHAVMAECVMINKGDHTIKVIEALREILTRMGGHQFKKRHTLRPLSIARSFIEKHK